jgi:hypothetical protein
LKQYRYRICPATILTLYLKDLCNLQPALIRIDSRPNRLTDSEIGAGAIVAASSAITRDLAADALALERGAQTEREGGARRFRERRGKPPKDD